MLLLSVMLLLLLHFVSMRTLWSIFRRSLLVAVPCRRYRPCCSWPFVTFVVVVGLDGSRTAMLTNLSSRRVERIHQCSWLLVQSDVGRNKWKGRNRTCCVLFGSAYDRMFSGFLTRGFICVSSSIHRSFLEISRTYQFLTAEFFFRLRVDLGNSKKRHTDAIGKPQCRERNNDEGSDSQVG